MRHVVAPASTPLFLALALALGGTATARAAEPDRTSESSTQQDAVLAQLQKLTEQLAAQQAEIERLRDQVEGLELAAERGRGPAPAQTAVTTTGAPGPAAQQDPTPRDIAREAQRQATELRKQQEGEATPEQIGQAQREDDEQRREQEKALVVREHAPLFQRKFTFDVGTTYSFYDRRALSLSGFLALDAIFLGTIDLDQTKASVNTIDLTGRYGLSDRWNLEVNVPYVFRDTRFISGGAGGASSSLSEVKKRSDGIGDVSAAVYYQVLKENARRPDVVASLRLRTPTGRDPFGLKLVQVDGNNTNLNVPEDLPTGTGVYSLTANVSVLRTYDPVILFGNLGYVYNRPEDFDDISPVLDQISPAQVRLGNTVQLSGGMAIALNDRSAISFSAAAAISSSTRTRAPGEAEVRVPGSSANSASLNIGTSYVLPSGWTINGQLGAGLTPDAPDFVFGIRASRTF